MAAPEAGRPSRATRPLVRFSLSADLQNGATPYESAGSATPSAGSGSRPLPRPSALHRTDLEKANNFDERPSVKFIDLEKGFASHSTAELGRRSGKQSLDAQDGLLWKLNGDVYAGSPSTLMDLSCWRRRRFDVVRKEDDVCLMYMSEQHEEMKLGARLSSLDELEAVCEMPEIILPPLKGLALEKACKNLREYALAFKNVPPDEVYEDQLPRILFPFSISWRDASNTLQCLVVGTLSNVDRRLWLQRLRTALESKADGEDAWIGALSAENLRQLSTRGPHDPELSRGTSGCSNSTNSRKPRLSFATHALSNAMGNAVGALTAATERRLSDNFDVFEPSGGRKEKGDLSIEEENRKLMQVFKRFDKDGDDTIDASEMHHVISACGVHLNDGDASRLLRAIDVDDDGHVAFHEFCKFRTLRVIESVRHTSIIDTRRTVMSQCLGHSSKMEQFLFDTAVNASGWKGRMLWIMWYTGLLLGLVSQQSIVLPWYPLKNGFNFCSLLMLPLPLMSLGVLSVDSIKELLVEGKFYALLGLSGSWLFSTVRLLQDIRCLYWLCVGPSILVAALSDSYPARFRNTFQKLFFVGLVISMSWWNLTVVFSLNEPIHESAWQFRTMVGSTSTSSVANTFTALVFAVNNLYTAWRNPENFCMICSAARTVKVSLKDLADGPLHKRHSTISGANRASIRPSTVRPSTTSHRSSVISHLSSESKFAPRSSLDTPLEAPLDEAACSSQASAQISGFSKTKLWDSEGQCWGQQTCPSLTEEETQETSGISTVDTITTSSGPRQIQDRAASTGRFSAGLPEVPGAGHADADSHSFRMIQSITLEVPDESVLPRPPKLGVYMSLPRPTEAV